MNPKRELLRGLWVVLNIWELSWPLGWWLTGRRVPKHRQHSAALLPSLPQP